MEIRGLISDWGEGFFFSPYRFQIDTEFHPAFVQCTTRPLKQSGCAANHASQFNTEGSHRLVYIHPLPYTSFVGKVLEVQDSLTLYEPEYKQHTEWMSI
jgi:hypothetical protein